MNILNGFYKILPSSFSIKTSLIAIGFLSAIPILPAHADEINCFQPINEAAANRSPEEKYKAGYCLVKQGEYEEAVTRLQGLESELPIIGDYVLYYKGFAQKGAGDIKSAEETLNRVVTIYPSSVMRKNALASLAEIYADNGDYAKVESTLKSIYVEEGDSQTKATYLNKLGEALEKQGKYKEAVDTYKKLWVEFPESTYADAALNKASQISSANGIPFSTGAYDYLQRAEKLYKISKWDAALKNYNKTIETSDSKMKMAIASFNLRRYNDAKGFLAQINSGEARFWTAKIYAKQGKDEDAAKTYHSVYTQYPQSPQAAEALYNAGRLYQINKNSEQAIELYDLLIRKYPDSKSYSDGSWNLGWIHYRRGSYPEALATFSSIMSKGSQFDAARATYWKARILEKQGNTKDASALYDSLARSTYPSYYVYLARTKTGYNISLNAPEFSSGNAAETLNSGKAEFLIRLGIFDDANPEIKKLQKNTSNSRESLYVSSLYAKVNDYYDSIAIASGIATPEALRLSYPKGFGNIAKKHSQKYGVDELIVYSIMREESRFDRNAVSPAGAIGLMQLMPATGKATARETNIDGYNTDMLYTPMFNIELGTAYFKKMLGRFGGTLQFTIASYNAGPANVDNWRTRFAGLDLDEFVEEIPFQETRNYVRRVLRSYGVYKAIYEKQVVEQNY